MQVEKYWCWRKQLPARKIDQIRSYSPLGSCFCSCSSSKSELIFTFFLSYPQQQLISKTTSTTTQHRSPPPSCPLHNQHPICWPERWRMPRQRIDVRTAYHLRSSSGSISRTCKETIRRRCGRSHSDAQVSDGITKN